MLSAKTVLTARLTLPTDVDLDKETKRADLVKSESAVNEPALQRLLVHRGYLLIFMAAAYVLFFLDNCWSITTEFKTYDAIVRCPSLAEPDFLTKNLSDTAYYTGWWEQCGATEAGKQHRILSSTNGVNDKAVGSWCFSSLPLPGSTALSFLLIPFANIATSTTPNMTTFSNAKLDQINATTDNAFAVYMKASPAQDPWYNEYVQKANNVVFSRWRTTYQSNTSFTPECGASENHTALARFSTFAVNGYNYEVRCFTQQQDGDEGSLDIWFYWPQGVASTDDAVYEYYDFIIYLTKQRNYVFTGAEECETIPALERTCCTSEQVLISAKNSPQLIKVRKSVAVIKVVMNAVSAVLAIAAAVKWIDIAASRKLAFFAWIAPFVVTCVLAMLPLATMADLKSDPVYDDSLIKTLDDADVDGLVKFFNILLPDQSSYLVDSLKQFFDENKGSGRTLAEIALQIEFRIKMMAGTLIPLALTALALPGAITKSSIQVKEVFPSSAWIGWLIRLMPVFYLPWATAIFCSLSQIFSGPFVTISVACFLLMKVLDLCYNPSVHTNSYASYQEYRTARRPTKSQFVILKTLLVASVAFLVVALFTDKYLKQLGVKALVGETPNLAAESAHFIIKFIIGFFAKSSNSIVMFSDILLFMVAFVAAAPPSGEDQRIANELAHMLSLPSVANAAPAAAI